METSAKGHELTAEQAGEGEILGAVGLGPAEFIGELPRHDTELMMTAGADGAASRT